MIKSLRNRPLRMVAIAVLPLALLGTACGSDDDGDSPADTEADAPADTEASEPRPTRSAGEESGEGNAEVEAFCTQVDEFVAAMDEVLADPSSGDVAEITAQGQDLAAAATDLAGSVEGDDSERLQECTEELSTHREAEQPGG